MQNGKDVVGDCIDSSCKGSLGFHRGQDSALYDMYARKLLQRGWAGNMDAAEHAYLKRKKVRSPKQEAADEGFMERMQARRGV